MDTQTYSAKTVHRQLLKLYLILSIIACGAAFLYIFINRTSAEASLISARSADIASQSELTTRWLNSKIAMLPGEDVRAFWQTFADKLRGLEKYITESYRHAKTDRLRDGFQENDFQKYDTPQSHSRWELSKEDTPEINYGFASFYPQKRFASVNPSGNQPQNEKVNTESLSATPSPQKIEEDRERYDRLLGNVAGTFINIDTKNWPASKYSEYMLQDYFHVADVAKKRFPGLSILWIYVVSEGGSLGLYPGNSQTFKGYNLDERLWYRSIFYNEKKSDETSEPIIPNDPSFGLTPPYRDYVSRGFTRTFWHKISDSKIGYSYAICVDLILPLPELPTTSTTQAINNGKLLQSALFGFEIGIGAFVGFVLLSLFFGPTFTNIARFIFIGSLQRNDTAAGELFKVRDTAVVGKDRAKKFSYDWKDEQINQQRTVLTWLFNFKNVIFQVDASRVKQNQFGQGATYEDSFECKDLVTTHGDEGARN
jgi:hypothetical protein